MRYRVITAGVLGLLLAGVAVLGARLSLLPEGPAEVAIDHALVDVFVARQPIGFGARVTEDLVTTQAWPRAAVPHLAITDRSLLFPAGDGARIAKGQFFEGEVLLVTKLSPFGEEVRATASDDPSRRAMAIRVRGEAVAGGLVLPGDAVDLVFAEGQGREMRAVTLLRNVRVLGVAEGGLITVEVTPKDGQALALAQEAGILVASLRLGRQKNADAEVEALDLRTLLNEEAPEQTLRDSPSVVVRRGSETSVETVPRRGEE